MNRQYPEMPMVGVAAIILRSDQVLLVQRGREPAYGQWSLPGGLVELGESLHDAVRREVREEAGLDVEVVDVVAVLDRVITDAEGKIEYHYILIDLMCTSAGGEPAPASDVLACRFVPLEALSQYPMTHGTVKVIHQAVDKTRGKLSAIYDAEL
jgi:8-oxo-dGTP diphosphatase